MTVGSEAWLMKVRVFANIEAGYGF
jgi:hypothetical protein